MTFVTAIVSAVAEKLSRPVSEAVARGRRSAEDAEPEPREEAARWTSSAARSAAATSFPLLVLHLMRDEPVYGNRLMEGDRGDDRRRDLGQSQHDLPAAATTWRREG